jgi:hypothetical protein
MMSTFAQLTEDLNLILPDEITEQLQPSDRFIVWIDGDTIHLKRLNPSPLQIVEAAVEGDPLSYDEIDEIIHEVRRNRRAGIGA